MMGPQWPGADPEARVVVAVSIDGGPITQVERFLIPEISSSVISDVRRRAFSWGGGATIVWVRFPTVEHMLRSLDGEVNLKPTVESPEKPQNYVLSFGCDAELHGDLVERSSPKREVLGIRALAVTSGTKVL